jgi:hypothetical protein
MSNRNGLNELMRCTNYLIGNRGESFLACKDVMILAGTLVPAHVNAVDAVEHNPEAPW